MRYRVAKPFPIWKGIEQTQCPMLPIGAEVHIVKNQWPDDSLVVIESNNEEWLCTAEALLTSLAAEMELA